MTITFDVDPVKVGRLDHYFLPESLKEQCKYVIPNAEACGGSPKVRFSYETAKHGLNDAVNFAYDKHLPLLLSPDHIWLTIEREFALHINLHAEELRKHFVQFDGKEKLQVYRNEFVKGSPDNDWEGCFDEWTKKIQEKTNPKTYEKLVCDFSTTGPMERAISHLLLMDAMKNYFSYECCTLCGIPRITLTGTPDDWRKLRTKANILSEYGLGWWTDRLLPVLDEFVNAADGHPKQEWWRNFYKDVGGSGGSKTNGHINAFFPYEKEEGRRGEGVRYVSKKERLLEYKFGNRRLPLGADGDPWKEVGSTSLVSSLVSVPFDWIYYDSVFPMEIVGGLAAIVIDERTTTVQPGGIWAVRDANAKTLEEKHREEEEEKWDREQSAADAAKKALKAMKPETT